MVSLVSKVSMVAMDSKDERYNCYKCHGFYRLTHRYFVCSTKKKVLHEKLGDWGMGIRRASILGAVVALWALGDYWAVGAVEDR